MMFFVKDVGLSLLGSEVGNEALAQSAGGGKAEVEADGAESVGSAGKAIGRRKRKPGIEVRYV